MSRHAPLDMDAEIDSLYQLPLSEFVSRRDELAKTIRKAGDRESAARVKILSKPSVSAWAVNQLFWKHRNEFDRLAQAGQRVREAQGEGAGALREASGLRRRAVADTLRLAERILLEGGHAAGPSILRRVETSLESLAALGRSETDPPPGRLVEDVAPPGFEALAGLTLSLESRPSGPQPKPAKSPTRSKTDPRREEIRASLARARVELDKLRKKTASAELARDRTREAAGKTLETVLAAQRRWEEAVRQFGDAEGRALEAAREWSSAASQSADLEKVVEGLEAELAGLAKN